METSIVLIMSWVKAAIAMARVELASLPNGQRLIDALDYKLCKAHSDKAICLAFFDGILSAQTIAQTNVLAGYYAGIRLIAFEQEQRRVIGEEEAPIPGTGSKEDGLALLQKAVMNTIRFSEPLTPSVQQIFDCYYDPS